MLVVLKVGVVLDMDDVSSAIVLVELIEVTSTFSEAVLVAKASV